MAETLTALKRDALDTLPSSVSVPRYRMSDLRSGIVHIGVGNFHRAHQAWYLHRLMQDGKAHDWAIVGAGVRANDGAMRDRLKAQDYLTTLIELRPSSASAEVSGSMIDFVPVEDDNASLIAQMALPSTRIVSLTVTEGGYYTDPTTGSFDADHPEMIYDAANPTAPRSAFGAIVAALSKRRSNGTGPFTVQSCDNLQGNGDIVRSTVVSLARLQDPALARWISDTCSFPNSMVDCIVPATGAAEIEQAHAFGIADAAPVTHEYFRQWVIEDDFCAGRPDWDDVGATFTDQVHAYEAMKIRLLNAGHQVLANAGELLSVKTIADCMADPEISAMFRKVALTEIAPHVAPVPEMTPEAYVSLIGDRFSNPAIRDTTRRVAFDGSSRHTGFLLPVLRDALAEGTPFEGLALVEALWARMCAGTRQDGSTIEPNDPHWPSLTQAAQDSEHDPRTWLAQSSIYGDLSEHDAFAASFANWLRLIWKDGARAAIAQYVAT